MRRGILVILAMLAAWAALSVHRADACAIPVFRYALERWEPYPYEAIIFHKEPLGVAATNAFNALEKSHANLIREVIQ